MNRSILDRLRDIVDSAEFAARYVREIDGPLLTAAPKERDAVVYRIAVVGEASSHIPAEFRALAPEIPWNQVKDMRNHIIHGYWQIDFDIVAKTLAVDLDPLRLAANRLIGLIESADT